MSYYHTCPGCGAALDPGEECSDCNQNIEEDREMKKGVTKQELVKSLEETLKLTREEVVSLELTSRHEPEDTVIIHFKGGDKTVNISMDSGLAIIRDVSRAITY